MNKNVIPTDFTISLALIDFLPVLFFSLTGIILGINLDSIIFLIGAALTFISGFIKVLWKIIVVKKKKNIWWMFIQMRIVMPIGFLIMIIAFIIASTTKNLKVFYSSLYNPVVIVFLLLGLITMVLMIIFSIKLDSTNVKSNWIEQITNSISQLSFFIAFLLAYLLK